jgi:hypothetical protein
VAEMPVALQKMIRRRIRFVPRIDMFGILRDPVGVNVSLIMPSARKRAAWPIWTTVGIVQMVI